MARPADPSIRTRLRDQAVGYVMTHGIGDFALRPLAKALKTNARMLIYHFGSREGLMREILAGLRERESARVARWMKSGRKPRTMPEFLRWYWRRISAPQARSAVRPRVRAVRARLTESARLSRRAGRAGGVLAEARACDGHPVGGRRGRGNAAARRAARSASGPVRDIGSTPHRGGMDLLARLFEGVDSRHARSHPDSR